MSAAVEPEELPAVSEAPSSAAATAAAEPGRDDVDVAGAGAGEAQCDVADDTAAEVAAVAEGDCDAGGEDTSDETPRRPVTRAAAAAERDGAAGAAVAGAGIVASSAAGAAAKLQPGEHVSYKGYAAFVCSDVCEDEKVWIAYADAQGRPAERQQLVKLRLVRRRGGRAAAEPPGAPAAVPGQKHTGVAAAIATTADAEPLEWRHSGASARGSARSWKRRRRSEELQPQLAWRGPQDGPDPLGVIPFQLLDTSSGAMIQCCECAEWVPVHEEVVVCYRDPLEFFCRYVTGDDVGCSWRIDGQAMRGVS
eukprot:TRINITY_DN21604_c0_g1_i2.p1 TRINITY_DN21604_c0_g1~~TRINITY_DN21604_c0_g1_i2.p1  ORF type:complete len:308 (+),score=77.83 TRINITY_DN21604_c0_g1_i2:132-1055(+)